MPTLWIKLKINWCWTLFTPCRKRSFGELSEATELSLTPDPDNLLGRRIQHTWREKGSVTTWKGTVLERLTVNSSLYMVKYDGFDCVYGIELFKDGRVSNLQVLSEKVGECQSSLSEWRFRSLAVGFCSPLITVSYLAFVCQSSSSEIGFLLIDWVCGYLPITWFDRPLTGG